MQRALCNIGSSAAAPHNSDLRDSHEYTKKQMWVEQIYTRQSSRRFDFVETRPTEAFSIASTMITLTSHI